MTEQVKCAVCGKSVLKTSAVSVSYQGQTFYTCSPGCRDKFNKNPARYAKTQKASPSAGPSKPAGA